MIFKWHLITFNVMVLIKKLRLISITETKDNKKRNVLPRFRSYLIK